MDNLNTSGVPQEAAGATAASGQTPAPETQPTGTATGTSAPETGKAGGMPWEQDPRFAGKTADDVWKGYTELEKLKGELGRKAEVANLLEEAYGITPDQLKQQVEARKQAEQAEYYRQNPLEATVAPLQKQVQELQSTLAMQNEEKTLDSFLTEKPELQPFRDKLLQLALSVPEYRDNNVPYEQIANEWFGEAIKTGQNSAYQKIGEKQAMQTAPASGQERTTPTMEQIKNLPISERIKAIETMYS